jgi:hypothetical protein
LRAGASDLTVKFPAKHDGTAGKDQSGKDRPAAPAFRATTVWVLAMNPYPEKAELWTRESTCVNRLHGRTEDSAPRVHVRVRAERRWCNRVGADSEPELGERSSEQRNDTTARQGSAHGDDGRGTCKATGSARWPALKRRRVCAVARAGSGQHTISELTRLGHVRGSKAGRHSKRGLRCSPRALDATTRWWNEQRGMAWSRGSRAARSMASTATSSLCSSPTPWCSGEAAKKVRWSRGSRGWFGSFLPRTAPASGRTAAPASPVVHARADGDEDVRLQPPPRAASGSFSLSPSSSPSTPLPISLPLVVAAVDWGKKFPWAAADQGEAGGLAL